MRDEHDHQEIFERAMAQLGPLFKQSRQAMFIWMDPENVACNQRFAKLLGFRSAAEWARAVREDRADFMDPKTRAANVAKVTAALSAGKAIELPVKWRTRKGDLVPSRAIVVPFDVEGHRCALNFIGPVRRGKAP